jgi:hypothetical protein
MTREVIVIVRYRDTFMPQHRPGELWADEHYLDTATKRVWNVQENPDASLAYERPFEDFLLWVRYRLVEYRKPTAIGRWGTFTITNDRKVKGLSVPHMPVGAYAEADKIVLHGDGMDSRYGANAYGETVGGTHWQAMRLDVGTYEDFHTGHCDVHDKDNPLGDDETCVDCQAEAACDMGYCRCHTRLETCTVCNRDLGDGDDVWLCLDGGEFACAEHIVHDERPDSLFERTGTLRGEALPAFAWPGGYCWVYLTRDGLQVCAECAAETDTSDPVTAAQVDEEMNCRNCDDAQSEHTRVSTGPDGASADVGPCGAEEITDTEDGREVHTTCGCQRYYPPLCDGCGKPIDPALRDWWASSATGTKAGPVALDADSVSL